MSSLTMCCNNPNAEHHKHDKAEAKKPAGKRHFTELIRLGVRTGAVGAELIASDPAELGDGSHQCAFDALWGVDA